MGVRSCSFATLAVGFLLVTVGCGGGGFESVSGTITLDGSPLEGAYITAIPQDAEVKGPFTGKTDTQGNYEIGPIADAGGGLPAGAYRLSITTAYSESANEMTLPPPERVPAPYPTGVDFTVPDGGTTDANFDLSSK